MIYEFALIVESKYQLWYAQKYENEQSGAVTVVPTPPAPSPTCAGKHVPMFGAVYMKNSVVLFTGQWCARTTFEISCCTCASVTQPAAPLVAWLPLAPPAAATGVSGQLTGSSAGNGFVSTVEPASVTLFW